MSNETFVHPTAVVEEGAQLGEGVYVGPFCVVTKRSRIGDRTRLEAYCVIGTPPEHKSHWHGEFRGVEIGADCIIREYVNVTCGTIRDTVIADRVCLLRGCYIAHDAIIETDVTVSGNAQVAGRVRVGRGANLGLGALIHQYCEIPPYTMLGMAAVVTKTSKLEPFGVYVGSPVRFLKTNEHAVRAFGFTPEQVAAIRAEHAARYPHRKAA